MLIKKELHLTKEGLSIYTKIAEGMNSTRTYFE